MKFDAASPQAAMLPWCHPPLLTCPDSVQPEIWHRIVSERVGEGHEATGLVPCWVTLAERRPERDQQPCAIVFSVVGVKAMAGTTAPR